MTSESTVTDLLFERGTLIDLHIGKPTFQKKLRQNDILVQDIDEKAIYLGHKKLIPPKAMEKLVTLEGKARQALARKSLPFPISGARFVHVNALSELLQSFADLHTEWGATVAELTTEYPRIKEEQLARLDEQNAKLAERELQKYAGDVRVTMESELAVWRTMQQQVNTALYPLEADLPKLFKFTWRMFRISPTEGLEDLSALSQRELADAHQQLKAELKTWVRQASADLHRALGEAALNASQMLERHNKLNPRNLKPLFDAFETFKAVDFTGTSDFRRVVDDIRRRFVQTNADGSVDYEKTATAVNETGRGAFQELLGNVARLAEDQVATDAGLKAIAHTGEFARVIEV